MYLSDKEIKAKLDEMRIECEQGAAPFSPDEQIQPCSIDLRLSCVFWEQTKKKSEAIDLRKSSLLELEPRRYWRKKQIKETECITLKPGQFLLGRICEKFTIPDDYAGKIEGRSSFVRMGLGIHIGGDFINPGYRGHMPLEIYNYSLKVIKIFPYIPICQLKLVQLSSTPEHLYGHTELQSKYMDDDGGPSYWWRDKRIKSLCEKFQQISIPTEIVKKIMPKIGIQEPEIIERFEKCIDKMSQNQIDNSDELLNSFADSEDKLRKKEKVQKGLSYILFPLILGALFSQPTNSFSYELLIVLALISIIPFYKALGDSNKGYLGKAELKLCVENLENNL